MKRTKDITAYEPPQLEAVEVRIEHGYDISFTLDAEDWQDGGGGNLGTD